jgi:hypothetical protein
MEIARILKLNCNSMHYFIYLLWETTFFYISDRKISSSAKKTLHKNYVFVKNEIIRWIHVLIKIVFVFILIAEIPLTGNP